MTKKNPPAAVRRKFLAVVDRTPECKVALHYAARRAERTGGTVTLLYVVQPADFQQWGGVERVMQDEARTEAEAFLHEGAKVVNDILGMMPELVIREGSIVEEVMKLLAEDRAISILILAAGTSKEGPGPLVSRIGSAGYPIPVTIVPGNLSGAAIDALA